VATKADIYETVTNRIIEALEKGVDGNKWTAPWHGAPSGLPENVLSHKTYRGVNVFALFSEQYLRGYESNVWGTFKQWKGLGHPVLKGETGTRIFLWKPTKRKVQNESGETETKNSLFATSYVVFNSEQVDGYVKPATEERTPFETVEHAHAFFAQIGADVSHGGDRAYYSPGADRIQLPHPEYFKDNVSYYATSAHEHVHWTGHEKRCARDFLNRFGSEAYAAEELVAELGSAYICGILGLANEPREDHTQYLANWLTILRNDPKAIVTAASKAQAAVDYLVEHAEVPQELEAASA